MRSLVSLMAISMVLVSCQGRHIDYSVGAGPQGGPGYKTTPPDHEGQFHEATIQISPDRTGQPDRAWPFIISVSCDNSVSETQFFADVATGSVRNSRYPDWINGQASCVGGASAETCQQVSVAMSPISFGSGKCLADVSGLVFTETTKQNCSLTGRLDGEAKREWATGSLTQMNLTSSGSSDVFVSGGLAELETAGDLAPKNVRPLLLEAATDSGSGFLVQFRFPTNNSKGIVITPLGNSDTLKSNGHGHYIGSMFYHQFDDGLDHQVELDFSCR